MIRATRFEMALIPLFAIGSGHHNERPIVIAPRLCLVFLSEEMAGHITPPHDRRRPANQHCRKAQNVHRLDQPLIRKVLRRFAPVLMDVVHHEDGVALHLGQSLVLWSSSYAIQKNRASGQLSELIESIPAIDPRIDQRRGFGGFSHPRES